MPESGCSGTGGVPIAALLIVEDDKKTNEAICEYLKSAGHETIPAYDGAEAIQIFREKKIDLAVLDIMLPKITGLAVLHEIRRTSLLPVLMLTAIEEEDTQVQSFDEQADDYITKPIDEEKLLLRIKALLRRARIVSEQRIVIGEVILDYNSFTVTRGDEVQVLPQKEFMVLYKLLSYPGQIFTRIQLMDEIWGTDSETGWETVTVHVGRLRKRFEGWNEFEIVAVRGLGYKAVKQV